MDSIGIVVLPNLAGIDLPAMEKIAQFCRSGGKSSGTPLPERVYASSEAASLRLRPLLAEMFGKAREDLRDSSSVWQEASVICAMSAKGLRRPSSALRFCRICAFPNAGDRHVHRRAGSATPISLQIR